ncbi:MAG TPA: protease [Pseudomonas xinjiangensis]|uniref:Protease n=2 Tax=root TaxID=1 RepID=A0A7V1BLV7_9GAMM|nr:protease [Halopseudomonas xinjiangensis]HEC47036.1 protease [Halopseudomonas xinjiangensis]
MPHKYLLGASAAVCMAVALPLAALPLVEVDISKVAELTNLAELPQTVEQLPDSLRGVDTRLSDIADISQTVEQLPDSLRGLDTGLSDGISLSQPDVLVRQLSDSLIETSAGLQDALPLSLPLSDSQILEPLLQVPGTVTTQLIAPLTATLAQPLELSPSIDLIEALPQRLPIVDSQGAPLFVEVEVEHGWRAVEREWLLLLSGEEWNRLLLEAPTLAAYVTEQHDFPVLARRMIRLKVPARLDSPEGMRQALPQRVLRFLDRNHIYTPQTSKELDDVKEAGSSGGLCDQPLRVGMIDTGVAMDHPAFNNPAGNALQRRAFLDVGPGAPEGHGTAVASVLIGRGPQLNPLLPHATLLSASVFYRQDDLNQGATLFHLLQAMEWLAAEGVAVINMSLTGPDNAVLHEAVAALLERGVQIVAAAGNEGPAAQPLYPAAYPGVLAATAVDQDWHLYRWANRGPHIAFAAPGVAVLTARVGGDYGSKTGTSMAAPVLTAFLACALEQHQGDAKRAWAQLMEQAEDLGEPGRDPEYGYGLLTPGSSANAR